MAKKAPVKKRKGYAGGGQVSVMGDQLADAYNRSDKGASATERYVSARNAETSARYNEDNPEIQKRIDKAIASYSGNAPGKLSSGRDLSLGRADYPGFKKGGKVKKVIRKR